MKLRDLIPAIAADKLSHDFWASVGFNVMFTAQMLANWREPLTIGDTVVRVLISLLAVALVFGAKEVSDAILNKRATGKWLGEPRNSPHGVEPMDFVYSMFGAVRSALPISLVLCILIASSK